MADEKISDLPAASSVADADLATVVQGGTNKKSAMSVIKTYITSALSAIYVPLTRTLTFGGITKSLAADRTWSPSDIIDGGIGNTQGDILYRGASAWTVLAPSTDGNVLTTHSTGANPTWTAPTGAPTTAHYLTSQSESGLSNEVNLGALTTGLLKGSVTGSVSTISSITDSSTNWDTAYTERHQWDGGATNLVAATGRTSLGATTVGSNVFTLTNPSAVTFPRINADNTVDALNAATFRAAIGAGTGGGDVSSSTGTSVDSEIAIFDGTSGKTIKRATGTGITKITSGVLSTASAGTDYADNAFKTFVVSGQSDIVADSAADTFTIAAGSNITLTTNAGTDTLTIAAAGSAQTHSLTLATDGSGAVLSTGTKNAIKIPYGGTLTGWLLNGSPSGSVTVDILRSADGAGLPVTSIVGGGGTKPSLSSATENSSTSFTSWTSTTLTAKDNIAISLSGVTGCTYVCLTLYFV